MNFFRSLFLSPRLPSAFWTMAAIQGRWGSNTDTRFEPRRWKR